LIDIYIIDFNIKLLQTVWKNPLFCPHFLSIFLKIIFFHFLPNKKTVFVAYLKIYLCIFQNVFVYLYVRIKIKKDFEPFFQQWTPVHPSYPSYPYLLKLFFRHPVRFKIFYGTLASEVGWVWWVRQACSPHIQLFFGFASESLQPNTFKDSCLLDDQPTSLEQPSENVQKWQNPLVTN